MDVNERTKVCSDEPCSTQVARPDGTFAGFKKYCTFCCDYHAPRHFNEDGICEREETHFPEASPVDLTSEQWKRLARLMADEAVKIMQLGAGWHWMGTPEDAGWYARQAYRACLQFQLAGGNPDAD